MHKFYFSKLQKPLLVSKMDVHNEQNANRSEQKKGMLQRGLDFIKKGKKSGSDKNATASNDAPVNSTTFSFNFGIKIFDSISSI